MTWIESVNKSLTGAVKYHIKKMIKDKLIDEGSRFEFTTVHDKNPNCISLTVVVTIQKPEDYQED